MRKGQKFEMNLVKTDKVCVHALSSLLPYIVALRKGMDSSKLGLSKEGKVICALVDPENLTKVAEQ